MASKEEPKKEDTAEEKVESEPAEPAKKEEEKEEAATPADDEKEEEEDAPEEDKDDDNNDEDGDDDDKSKRVYVGNLAWEVSWQDLKDLFNTTGHEITRADVMQTPDGRSKGCGIVEFATAEGAKQAILTLNDTELMGRQIFVREDREGNSSGTNNNASKKTSASSKNFSSGEQAQSRRVYVGNLSWDVAWPDLKDHMRSAGNVVHAEVICEHNGRSKGCGIVEYATEQEAQVAIDTLTHTELNGRMIFVREDRENSSNPAASNDNPKSGGGKDRGGHGTNTSVYIWNLSYDTTWQQLKDHCRKAGNVDQATILTNPEGSSIGCGVVVYQKAHDASRAIRELQDSELNGRAMKLREDRVQSGGRGGGRGGGGRGRGGRGGRGGGRGYRGPPSGGGTGTQLFVTNLPSGVTWQKLKDHFKKIGDVERANVKFGHDGPKFGTVRFYKKEDASKAIDKLNGVDLEGCSLEVRLDHQSLMI